MISIFIVSINFDESLFLFHKDIDILGYVDFDNQIKDYSENKTLLNIINSYFKSELIYEKFKIVIIKDNNGCLSNCDIFYNNEKNNDLKIKIKGCFEQNYLLNNTKVSIALLSRILDKDNVKKIENGLKIGRVKLNRLIGFNGWDSYEDLFFVLNKNTNWVVLRHYETLPYYCDDHDIDLLCEDISFFTLLSFAKKRSPGISAYSVKVSNINVDLDVRYVGDDYYCEEWQRNILNSYLLYNNYVPTPDLINYYYSYVYHIFCHKKDIKKEHENKIIEIRNALYSKSVNDMDYIISDLNDYMYFYNYKYVKPIDISIPSNKINTSKLIQKNRIIKPKIKYSTEFILIIKRLIFKMLPNSFINIMRKLK